MLQGSGSISEVINFSKPNSSNNGIYYIEIKNYDKDGNYIFSQYSPFNYIFTKQDIENQSIFQDIQTIINNIKSIVISKNN